MRLSLKHQEITKRGAIISLFSSGLFPTSNESSKRYKKISSYIIIKFRVILEFALFTYIDST